MIYGAVISEHYRRPRNQGALESPDAVHEGFNPLCGDRLRMEVKIEGGRIAAARFRGDACMVAIAAASLLTDFVRGLSIAEAAAFPREQLLAALEAPLRPSRLGCATLPLEVLRAALRERL
ncbi:MAG: iron-sulfur cluster assembly scaffold protein [Deltaproteobacteria bacterium]|nr:MAG: iron-sulfur cluster assembly scaffold protein [Deltaproteobacteria bacterium]